MKIGILGSGPMGLRHADAMNRTGRVEVVTGADSPEVLFDAGVDAVVLCQDNTRRAEVAIGALTHGVHVLCDLPVATDLEAAREVAEAAAASSAMLQVGSHRRFAPVYAASRRRLQRGFSVDAAHAKINRGELEQPAGIGDRSRTGGFLYTGAVQMFDVLRHLLGELSALRALGRANRYDETDDYCLLLEFDSSVTATLHACAHAGWMAPVESIELYGDRASLVTEGVDRLRFCPGLDWPTEVLDCRSVPALERWGHEAEAAAFLSLIEEGGKPDVTALDGLRDVAIVEAVRESVLGQGKRVPVAQE